MGRTKSKIGRFPNKYENICKGKKLKVGRPPKKRLSSGKTQSAV